MKFFILAGGYGKRARPLSDIKPKPSFPLHGKPLINLLLQQLKANHLDEGFVNIHYLPKDLKESINTDLKVHYLFEKELSGSRILHQSYPLIDDYLLVINGDIFLNIPVLEMQKKLLDSGADGVLLVRKCNDGRYSSLHIEGDDFIGVKEKNGQTFFMYTGVALFKKNVVEKIYEKSFFNTLQMNDFKILALLYEGAWMDIGEPCLYFRSNFKYQELINSASSNSVSSNVTISPCSRVRHSIIWENTQITHQSNVLNCIVTGNLSINHSNYINKIITDQGIFDLINI